MRPRKLRASEEIRALIRRMHPGLKKKVGAAIEVLLINPDHGKSLRDELVGLRSFRVGRLRIIYRGTPAAIEIVAIGPRRTIYEETLRLLRRDAPEERGRG